MFCFVSYVDLCLFRYALLRLLFVASFVVFYGIVILDCLDVCVSCIVLNFLCCSHCVCCVLVSLLRCFFCCVVFLLLVLVILL